MEGAGAISKRERRANAPPAPAAPAVGRGIIGRSGGLLGFFQRVRFGQVLDVGKPEDFEEVTRRAVKHGPADFFGPADNLDEVVFHEGAKRFAAGNAADDLDAGARDRLFVGDDGQGFEGGGGEPAVILLPHQALDVLRVLRQRQQLVPARPLLDPIRRLPLLVRLVQLLDRLLDRLRRIHPHNLRQLPRRQRNVRGKQDRFEHLEKRHGIRRQLRRATRRRDRFPRILARSRKIGLIDRFRNDIFARRILRKRHFCSGRGGRSFRRFL